MLIERVHYCVYGSQEFFTRIGDQLGSTVAKVASTTVVTARLALLSFEQATKISFCDNLFPFIIFLGYACKCLTRGSLIGQDRAP